MSGGISNLGMGLSGFGFTRPDSTVVKSGQEYQNDYDALRQAQAMQIYNLQGQQSEAAHNAANSIGNILSQNYGLDKDFYTNVGLQAFGYGSGGYDQQSSETLAKALLGSQYGQIQGIDNNAEIARIRAQQAEAPGLFAQQQQDRTNAFNTASQAYNQQMGGGYTGGLLNSNYANPFGNTITGSANPAASANVASDFTSGLMGQGGSAAAPSTGLAPTTPWSTPAATPQQSANAWGGPFSAKNPWSLS